MRQHRSHGTEEQKPPRFRGQHTLSRCASYACQRKAAGDSAGACPRIKRQAGAGRSAWALDVFGYPPPEAALRTRSCACESERATADLQARPSRIGHRRPRESHPQRPRFRWLWRNTDNSGQRSPYITRGDCGAYRACHNFLDTPFRETLAPPGWRSYGSLRRGGHSAWRTTGIATATGANQS